MTTQAPIRQDGSQEQHAGATPPTTGKGFFAGPATWFHAIKAHPIIGLVMAVIIAVVGFIGEDLYHKYKPWKEDQTTFIADMEKRQNEQFDDIKTRLDSLRSAMPSEGRDAFRALESSLSDLKSDSAGLVAQLAVAKQENDAMRQALAQANARVSGGFDFTLGRNASFRLDDITTLGVSRIGNNGVNVNLSHPDKAQNRFLSSGEGLSYRGANGQACIVTLHTFRDSAASFAVSCV